MFNHTQIQERSGEKIKVPEELREELTAAGISAEKADFKYSHSQKQRLSRNYGQPDLLIYEHIFVNKDLGHLQYEQTIGLDRLPTSQYLVRLDGSLKANGLTLTQALRALQVEQQRQTDAFKNIVLKSGAFGFHEDGTTNSEVASGIHVNKKTETHEWLQKAFDDLIKAKEKKGWRASETVYVSRYALSTNLIKENLEANVMCEMDPDSGRFEETWDVHLKGLPNLRVDTMPSLSSAIERLGLRIESYVRSFA